MEEYLKSLKVADNPAGEWNSFRILMIGGKFPSGSMANLLLMMLLWRITGTGVSLYFQKALLSFRHMEQIWLSGIFISERSLKGSDMNKEIIQVYFPG